MHVHTQFCHTVYMAVTGGGSRADFLPCTDRSEIYCGEAYQSYAQCPPCTPFTRCLACVDRVDRGWKSFGGPALLLGTIFILPAALVGSFFLRLYFAAEIQTMRVGFASGSWAWLCLFVILVRVDEMFLHPPKGSMTQIKSGDTLKIQVVCNKCVGDVSLSCFTKSGDEGKRLGGTY